MKGIVFTELFEMIEESFGLETLDKIINEADLQSDGIYTAVGTYDASEIGKIVSKLHEISNIPIADLVETFGRYLFKSLNKIYPQFTERAPDLMTFLESINSYIHPEVYKLYPDAELPHFDTVEKTDSLIILKYRSKRKMYVLAKGLIHSAADFFNEKIEVEIELEEDDGSVAIIKVQKVDE